MVRRRLSLQTLVKRRRKRGKMYRRKLEIKYAIPAIPAMPDRWQEILGNKELIVLLHKIEVPDIKPDIHLATHCESIDNAIDDEDRPLIKRLQTLELSDIKSEEQYVMHNEPIDTAIKEEDIPLVDRLQKCIVKSEDHSEMSPSTDIKIELDASNSKRSFQNIITKELRVVLKDIRPQLETKNYVFNFMRNIKSVSRECANHKRKFSMLSDDSSTSSLSSMRVKKELHSPVLQTPTKDVCGTVHANNTPRTKLEDNGEEKHACTSGQNAGGVKKKARKVQRMEKLQDVTNRSVTYLHNLNVISQSSTQESTQQSHIKPSPEKKVADHLVLNTSKDTVRNIGIASTSDVSSTFNFNDNWNSGFKNRQSFGKQEPIMGSHCNNEKIERTPLKVYKEDEQSSCKAKTSHATKFVEKVKVRNNVLFTGSPYAIKVLNEDESWKQTLTQKEHTQNDHHKVGAISFGKINCVVEPWNANDVNFEKARKTRSKLNINAGQPGIASEYKTKGRNDQKKILNKFTKIQHKSPMKIAHDIPVTLLRKNMEASSKTIDLGISDTESCTYSNSSQDNGLGDVESLSDGSEIMGGGNKSVENGKLKFKHTLNLGSTSQNAQQRIKLNRSSWHCIKDNHAVQSCNSSNSLSLASTHLLSPPNDISSSTEISRKVLNYYVKQDLENEFGRLASKNCFLGPETSRNPEVKMVTPDLIELHLKESPTRFSAVAEEDTISDNPPCSKEKSAQEDNIKTLTKKRKRSPNAKRQTISDVTKCRQGLQTTVHESEDPKLKLTAEADTKITYSVKSRLGPQAERESSSLGFKSPLKLKGIASPSVKSRLGPRCDKTDSKKSTSKASTPSADTSPADERSKQGSPYTCLANERLKGFSKKLKSYKIPKISRNSINESMDSNSQHSQTPETCTSNPTNENSDDEDYIILHPEECFSDIEDEFDDLESKKASSQTAESFSMTDSVFDRFMTKNQSEFDAQYENSKDANSQNSIFDKEESDKSLKFIKPLTSIKLPNPKLINNTVLCPSDHTSASENNVNKAAERFFYGQCFSFLRNGNCRTVTVCKFKHDESYLCRRILRVNWTLFMDLFTHMAERNYMNLLRKVVKEKIWQIETNEIISLLKMLYEHLPQYFHDPELVLGAIDALRAREVPLKEIISKFLTIVSDDICKCKLFCAIKKRTLTGALWDTAKDLILSIKNLSTYIVRDVMLECVGSRPENASDVNDCIVTRMVPLFRATISHKLMARFQSLIVEPEQKHDNASLPMSSQSNDMPIISHGMSSQDQIKLDNCLQDYNNVTSASTPVRTNTQSVFPQRNICNMKDDNNNINDDTSKTFVVEQIDNLPAPNSIFRDRFSQFYGSLDALRQALGQENYKFAIQILDYVKTARTDNTFYTLSCYRILCQEIKLSAHHMNKIKTLTVQMNVDFALRKSLADITKYILIRLVDEGLYMLACNLLENWKELVDCNASFSLLMAEIYLGCDQPLEALDVLRRYNIIHTNRCKWTLPSDVKDENFRQKLLPLLLNALSITKPEHAFYLLEFLTHIQSSNFHPIDLTRCVDAVVSAILLAGDMELIERTGRLIFAYNIPLAAITYRALIATAIAIDTLLARQLYRIAMSRGIYGSTKFQPITHIVINPDLTFEEVYLTLSEFIRDILINIGPALDRLKCNQILAYIFIESICSHGQTGLEETDNSHNAYKKLRAFKNLICKVLQARFEPPIKLTPRPCDKILRLQPTSLLNYLRAGHL